MHQRRSYQQKSARLIHIPPWWFASKCAINACSLCGIPNDSCMIFVFLHEFGRHSMAVWCALHEGDVSLRQVIFLQVFTSGRPVDYYSSSIVTDGELLYLFGGCILNGGATSARNTLYTLKPGPTSSREVPLRWKVMPTGAPINNGHHPVCHQQWLVINATS